MKSLREQIKALKLEAEGPSETLDDRRWKDIEGAFAALGQVSRRGQKMAAAKDLSKVYDAVYGCVNNLRDLVAQGPENPKH